MSRWRDLGLTGLHLAVLWTFAFAQPLLDLLGDTPEFFVARGNTRGDILLLALGLVLLPPLALTLLEAFVGLISTRLRRGLHLCLVAVLTAAFTLQLIADISIRPAVLLAVALAIGALFALAYARTRAAPVWLTVLGPAPIVFLVVFLVFSPASKLVLPGDQVETASVAVPGEPPVIVIVFDELAGLALIGPDGRIDASRFPNFARLAQDATWYRNATTVADFTDRAVPALLTGEMPDKGALPIAADHPESLFTLLGGRYSLDVAEPMTDICPERLCPEEAAERQPAGERRRELVDDLSLVSLHLLLPEPLRSDLEPVDRSFGDFRRAGAQPTKRAPALAGLVSAGLAARENAPSIFHAFEQRLEKAPRHGNLIFFHTQLPHNPYHFLPSGQRYPETVAKLPGILAEGQPAGGAWGQDAGLAHLGLKRYLLQVGYADRLLGRALDRLEERGIYDRSLVAVMADHGASFTPGTPHRAARAENLTEIAGVPLLIKSPGQHNGEIDESNVNTTAVLPTVADRLGVSLPWPTDGRPADQARRGGRITLQPHYGEGNLSLSFTEFVRRRDEIVRRMHADFGRGWAGLFRSGADADLVGAEIEQLGVGSAPGASFELDGGGVFGNVDPGGPIVPSMVSGVLSGVPSAARLVVAVNGRVVATAVRFREGDLDRFTTMVPATAFARGANTVEVIAVTRSEAGRRLARLPTGVVDYRLVRRGEREVIVAGGREIPVDSSGNGGFLDQLKVEQANLIVGGWAADSVRRRVADRVLAFAGDRFVAAGRPSTPRPDVAQSRGPDLTNSGFALKGATTGPMPGSPEAPVRVFAVFGSRALPVPPAPGVG